MPWQLARWFCPTILHNCAQKLIPTIVYTTKVHNKWASHPYCNLQNFTRMFFLWFQVLELTLFNACSTLPSNSAHWPIVLIKQCKIICMANNLSVQIYITQCKIIYIENNPIVQIVIMPVKLREDLPWKKNVYFPDIAWISSPPR